MTLVELLTTMTILALVLTAIIGLFVSSLHAEVDMNNRFQAQQNARLALTSLRTDVRTACTATVSNSVVTGDTLQLGVCSGASTTWSATPVSWVTWCIRNEGGSPAHYGLYRESGSSADPSCATHTAGIREADWLTAAVGSNPVFVYVAAPASGLRPQVQVTIPVDTDPATSAGVYRLSDTIMLRNAQPAS